MSGLIDETRTVVAVKRTGRIGPANEGKCWHSNVITDPIREGESGIQS